MDILISVFDLEVPTLVLAILRFAVLRQVLFIDV